MNERRETQGLVYIRKVASNNGIPLEAVVTYRDDHPIPNGWVLEDRMPPITHEELATMFQNCPGINDSHR